MRVAINVLALISTKAASATESAKRGGFRTISDARWAA
jgi:hypothetical protein